MNSVRPSECFLSCSIEFSPGSTWKAPILFVRRPKSTLGRSILVRRLRSRHPRSSSSFPNLPPCGWKGRLVERSDTPPLMLRFSLPPPPTAAAVPQGLTLHLAAAASPRHSSRHRYRCLSSPCALSALSGLPLRPLWCAQPRQDSAPAVADDGEDGGLGEELHKLLALLPEGMRERVGTHPELPQLVEIVMDLGRRPLARFPSGDFVLSDNPITLNDLHHATSQVCIMLESELRKPFY